MEKIVVWHNPRCMKSRKGLKTVEDVAQAHGLQVEIRKYLEHPPTHDELKDVIRKLDIKPIDLIRKQEKIWKELFKGKDLSDDELIDAMVKHPKLIERPIVIYKDKAVVARPEERVFDLFV